MSLTLEQQIEAARKLLESYVDLATEQDDDDSYVARGNGFCDRKYSQEFIDLQVAQLTARVADLKKKLDQEA